MDEEQKAYLLNRLEQESANSETEFVNSIGVWCARDQGEGLYASGVNVCMAIASPSILAHIHAGRTESEID